MTLFLLLISCAERQNPAQPSPPGYEIVTTIPPLGIYHHLYIDSVDQTGYLSADYIGVLKLNLSNPANPIIMDTLKNSLTPGPLASSWFSQQSNIIYMELWPYAGQSGVRAFGMDSINTASAFLLNGGSPPVQKFQVREFFPDSSSTYVDSIHLYLGDIGEVNSFCRVPYVRMGNIFIQRGSDNYSPLVVYDFVIRDSLAYLAVDEYGMRIVNLSPSYVFPEVGGFDTEGFCRGIDLQGDYCYLADRHWGLQILDVANPAQPVRVANLKFPGADDCEKVKVHGDYAAVLDAYDGVYMIDISDPANPVELFSFDTITPTDILLTDNYLYVIDEDAGLIIATW
jgi:hypothetical protein